MYVVTILWQGSEIGYGQGESMAYAKREALDSVSSFYREARREWQFIVRREA